MARKKKNQQVENPAPPELDGQVNRAASSPFWEHYKHPNWQRKRLEIMQRAGFRCENCDDNGNTLNVHHSYYEKNHKPWEYPDESLHCLCEKCHKAAEVIRREPNSQFGRITLSDMETLLGFARGLELLEFPNVQIKVSSHPEAVGVMSAWAGNGLKGKVFLKLVDGLIELLIHNGGVTDGLTIDSLTGGAFDRERAT